MILHCVSNYPVKSSEANLLTIQYLKDNLDCAVGYSDHTLGVDACILAVGMGARVIEKHFTKDKNLSDFRDHQLSADPEEMALLVEQVKKTEILLGKYQKAVSENEQNVNILARRSIAAKSDLSAGSTISNDDVIWLRPGNGLTGDEANALIGRTLLHDIKAGRLFNRGDVQS